MDDAFQSTGAMVVCVSALGYFLNRLIVQIDDKVTSLGERIEAIRDKQNLIEKAVAEIQTTDKIEAIRKQERFQRRNSHDTTSES